MRINVLAASVVLATPLIAQGVERTAQPTSSWAELTRAHYSIFYLPGFDKDAEKVAVGGRAGPSANRQRGARSP